MTKLQAFFTGFAQNSIRMDNSEELWSITSRIRDTQLSKNKTIVDKRKKELKLLKFKNENTQAYY